MACIGVGAQGRRRRLPGSRRRYAPSTERRTRPAFARCVFPPFGVYLQRPARTRHSGDHFFKGTETSKMNPNDPSRTAVMIARQRAAHQVLDHGSILNDPFAMKILQED